MLYDAKRAGVYSVENLAAWLGQQPRYKKYDYCAPAKCAAAQYLKAHGVENYILSPEELRALGWHEIVFCIGQNTFAQAHRRARLIIRNDWLTSIARAFCIL